MCLSTNDSSMCEWMKQKQVWSSIIIVYSVTSLMITLGSPFVWIWLSHFIVGAKN